jgi:hypothetical protein
LLVFRQLCILRNQIKTLVGGQIKIHPTAQGHLKTELAADYAGFLKLTGEKSKIMVFVWARFCHYFTPTIRVPLGLGESKFSHKTESFLKIPA